MSRHRARLEKIEQLFPPATAGPPLDPEDMEMRVVIGGIQTEEEIQALAAHNRRVIQALGYVPPVTRVIIGAHDQETS